MIGAKAITSIVLVVTGIVLAFLLLSPARVAALDGSTFFWIGVCASISGPLVVRFWGLHQGSAFCFLHSYDERLWEDESHFVGIGRFRITIAQNEGEAIDLPAGLQYAIYIGLAFVVGLLSIDSRAINLVKELPSKLAQAGSQYCPDTKVSDDGEETESPGCALLRRAYDLGYAKSLGPCAKEKEDEQGTGEICRLRQRDEPFLHYGWRLLADAWTAFRQHADPDYFVNLAQVFDDKVGHLDTLYSAQRHVVGTGPRASHHIWTNLPHPEGWLHATTRDALEPGRCLDRYRRLPHRPRVEDDTMSASLGLDHVLGKLLFESRYAPPAGFCREYTIHWGSPADACAQLAQRPEEFLAQTGAVESVLTVLERHELARQLDKLAVDGS
ncbi:hypothetical protein ACFL6C_12800, partial [Myxococcota bacterium]